MRVNTRQIRPKAGGLVPAHDQLIRAGLVEYVARIRDGGSERLWPDLNKSPGTRKWGSAYSKAFGRARRRVGISDRRVNFHSLRSTFTTALLNSGCPLERVDYLLGHAPSGTTLKAYRKSVDLGMLRDDLRGLGYPGLTLGHLGRLGET